MTEFHLLCADCHTAVVVESFAKRRSVRRRPHCPFCEASHSGTWSPIIGRGERMEKVIEREYETYSPSHEAVSWVKRRIDEKITVGGVDE